MRRAQRGELLPKQNPQFPYVVGQKYRHRGDDRGPGLPAYQQNGRLYVGGEGQTIRKKLAKRGH